MPLPESRRSGAVRMIVDGLRARSHGRGQEKRINGNHYISENRETGALVLRRGWMKDGKVADCLRIVSTGREGVRSGSRGGERKVAEIGPFPAEQAEPRVRIHLAPPTSHCEPVPDGGIAFLKQSRESRTGVPEPHKKIVRWGTVRT